MLALAVRFASLPRSRILRSRGTSCAKPPSEHFRRSPRRQLRLDSDFHIRYTSKPHGGNGARGDEEIDMFARIRFALLAGIVMCCAGGLTAQTKTQPIPQ